MMLLIEEKSHIAKFNRMTIRLSKLTTQKIKEEDETFATNAIFCYNNNFDLILLLFHFNSLNNFHCLLKFYA